jgi:CRP-like cAMP-binding protein
MKPKPIDFQPILHHIALHIALNEAEQAQFLEQLQPVHIRKKDFLLQENEVCRHSAFVLQGCLRAYHVDGNGFEHVLQFAPEGWWVADMYSLLSGKPGHLTIEALEDSDLLLLSKDAQEQLYRDIPKFERFFRIITENSLVSNRQRVMDTLSLNARERYAQFCQKYPSLIERLPQKQIAAYIGVTPEFLSTLRAEWRKKKS